MTTIPRVIPWALRRRSFMDTARFWLRKTRAAQRALPDFFIIGAQKAGTTSLYNYLAEHPQVVPAYDKEPHFLHLLYDKGEAWYRAHFPLERELGREGAPDRKITGEATPSLFHPCASARLAAMRRDVKLIAIFRHPVQRTYSHYQHNRRRGNEDLTFDEALAAEPARLAGSLEQIEKGEPQTDRGLNAYGYVQRSEYARNLQRWFDHFPPEQFLLLTSDELFGRTEASFHRVCEFLGVDTGFTPKLDRRHNVGGYSQDMNEDTKHRLLDHFRPHNAALEKIMGRPLHWDE